MPWTDGASQTVFTMERGPNGKFEGAGSDDIISGFGRYEHDCRQPECIPWNSTTGRLAVLSKTGSKRI